jgi:hypothetical protein
VQHPVSNDAFEAALDIREADEGGETGEAGSGGGNAAQENQGHRCEAALAGEASAQESLATLGPRH